MRAGDHLNLPALYTSEFTDCPILGWVPYYSDLSFIIISDKLNASYVTVMVNHALVRSLVRVVFLKYILFLSIDFLSH